MPRYITHMNGAYNVFTTVCDSFIFEPALTPSELEEWYYSEFGKSGMRDLPARVQRAHDSGSSGLPPFDGIDWMIESNRQGDSEVNLSREECIRRFLTLPATNE